jgi:hypothetical protein
MKNINQIIDRQAGFIPRDKRGLWIFRLTEPKEFSSPLTGITFQGQWLTILPDGKLIITKGYAWDGCTPKWNILDLFILGTPDGIINYKTGLPKTYYASLVHDALYQYKHYLPFTRKQIDKLFLEMLQAEKFVWAWPYYFFVRTFGWVFNRPQVPADPKKLWFTWEKDQQQEISALS